MNGIKVIAGASVAAISVMVAVAAVAQMDTTARSDGPRVESVVDANGSLHVPDTYGSTYEFLGG